nr:DNA helicase [Tanacetum cinerariifolium]
MYGAIVDYKGQSPPLEYKYIGKCEHSCEHCGARLWYEERIKDTRRRLRLAYHRCCMAGRVVLRTYQIYPEYIQLLLRDCHFMENIRAYNQMFSMTSQVEGERPRFLQLYVYDTDNEVDNRMFHFGGSNSDLRRDIVEGLIELLDKHNALVQLFRTAREKLLDSEVPPFKVRLFNIVGAREYELPTKDMLGMIFYEPGSDTDMDFDIVIDQRIGQPQRVNKLHPSYMALQFPLLFVYGEDGYSKDMKMVRALGMSSNEDKRFTMKAYYSYMLHDHVNSFNYLSKTERLFQQYMVTALCFVEQSRIDFICEHQNDIRNEYLSGIYDAIRGGDSDGSDCGGRLILPQSFIGGPCYMYAHYLDALAICRVHGNPAYFITFTCNVKWPEITKYMDDFPGVTTADRADIVDRVFEMKIHHFVKYLRDIKHFGKVIAIVYTVEFQKRGLTHCHTLWWVDENSRVHNYEDIENYISAELPSKEIDPEGHMVVVEFMIHGPCDERVVFREIDQLESMANNPHKKKTTLTEWDIRTVNHIVYPTCRAACEAMGLLGDDKEWETTLIEALLMEEKSYNRDLLAIKRDKLIGKTFLWKTIIYALRAEGKIVLAVASSGIASLLLPSETDLIIWDGSPMNDRRCFETLDRTLRDILDTSNKLFGGKPIMLGGDFRQTLPVKKSASRDGVLGVPDESNPENTSWLEILATFQIPNDDNGLTKLIEFIYDKDTLLHPNAKDLQDKEIVCLKNDTADVINAKVMDMLPGCATTYISNDEAIPHGNNDGEVELLYPIEYLNSLNFAGIPPHELKLKIGSPIITMELANVDGTGQQNKGKIILTEPKITYISELSNTAYDKTIEAIGTPIQANMGLLDAEYFDQLLQLQKAYRLQRVTRQADCKESDTNSGNIIGCTLWNEMAANFDKRGYHLMEKPVVIAVSSCYINRYHGLQLSGTSATHYYLNPNIKPKHSKNKPTQRIAMVNDGSTTTPITCFSDQAHTLTRNVNEVVAELQDKNHLALPLCLQQLQGSTHIFQFHFDTMTSSRRPDFVLDKVFLRPTLALPQPEPIEAPEPDTASSQETPQQSPTLEEIKQTYEEYHNKEPKESDDSEQTVFTHSTKPQITTP